MEKLIVYQKPTCTSCRSLKIELEKCGVDFASVDYFLDPLSENKILELIKKSKQSPEVFIRKKEPLYKTLGLKQEKLDAKRVAELLANYPDLIERPIVEWGARVIVARPIEKIHELLKSVS